MTQWRNGGTKDTTVRRKRVVMGRESRGVLLLVALAALAAALDAFSTDSKSRISFMSAEHSSRSETASERGSEHEAGRAGGGGGRREREPGPEGSLARIHPAASRLSTTVARVMPSAAFISGDISRRIFQLRLRLCARCPPPRPLAPSLLHREARQ